MAFDDFDTVTCDCGNIIPIDASDEWWCVGLRCDECDRECTGTLAGGKIPTWTSARDAAISRAEMDRQQFSADCNDMFGRGNHCF
jgi:hypothetical protein